MTDTDDEQDAEFPAEDSAPPRLEGTTEPKKRGGGMAWLAMLLSIIALAAVGFTQFEAWRTADDSSALDTLAEIGAVREDAANVARELETLRSEIDNEPEIDISGELDTLQRNLDARLETLDTLPARMSTLENSVAALAGISEGARETFLLAEAEYYMQIANAQLQLANNPELAELALGMADERVTQLADPGLTDVRRALANELAALSTMQKPDLEGASLTLASLARVVESLPLAGIEPGDPSDEASDVAGQGNVERAWTTVKDAMSGLVKVTPPDQAKLELLSPDAEYFLRNNIALQLQAARLALLRGEQAIFESTLDDTSTLLNQYFDSDSNQVQSTLQTIDEIRNSVLTASAPDIAGSLRLLRQYRTVSESAE